MEMHPSHQLQQQQQWHLLECVYVWLETNFWLDAQPLYKTQHVLIIAGAAQVSRSSVLVPRCAVCHLYWFNTRFNTQHPHAP